VSPAVYFVKSKVDEKRAIILFERSFEASGEVYGNRSGNHELPPPIEIKGRYLGNTTLDPGIFTTL